jgi:hypothetical protein
MSTEFNRPDGPAPLQHVNERDEVERFKQAAKKFNKENSVSREKANEALIRIGLLGADGKLSPNLK